MYTAENDNIESMPKVIFSFYKENELFTNSELNMFISICKIFPEIELHPSMLNIESENIYNYINNKFNNLIITENKSYVDAMLKMIDNKFIKFKDENPYEKFTDEIWDTIYVEGNNIKKAQIYNGRCKILNYIKELNKIVKNISNLTIDVTPNNTDIIISPLTLRYNKENNKLLALGKREYIEKYINHCMVNTIIDHNVDIYTEHIDLLTELINKYNCEGDFLYFINFDNATDL